MFPIFLHIWFKMGHNDSLYLFKKKLSKGGVVYLDSTFNRSNNNKIEKYREKNKTMLKDPLRKNFLEIPEYNALFEDAILSNFDKEKVQKVEEAFNIYYEQVRKKAYLINMLRQSAIDFDKKVRKQRQRFLLTLDQPINDNDSLTFKEKYAVESSNNNDSFPESNLYNEIADEKLFNLLGTLSEKQYQIVDLCYFKQKSNSEVAQLLNTTPQNVSNLKRKILRKLKDGKI